MLLTSFSLVLHVTMCLSNFHPTWRKLPLYETRIIQADCLAPLNACYILFHFVHPCRSASRHLRTAGGSQCDLAIFYRLYGRQYPHDLVRPDSICSDLWIYNRPTVVHHHAITDNQQIKNFGPIWKLFGKWWLNDTAHGGKTTERQVSSMKSI